MADVKKNAWKRYLDMFVKQEDGSFVYTGPYYIPQNTDWKSIRKILTRWLVGCAACLLLAGVIPAKGMIHSWFVLFPYVSAVIMTIVLAIHLIRVTDDKGNVHAYTYEHTIQWYSPDSLTVLFCIVLCTAGEIFAAFSGDVSVLWEIAAIAVYALAAFCIWNFRTFINSVSWKRKEGKKSRTRQ